MCLVWGNGIYLENGPGSKGCSPANPSFFPTSTNVLPFCWFNFETIVSAGWDTIAQKTPAAIRNLKDSYNLYVRIILDKHGLKGCSPQNIWVDN